MVRQLGGHILDIDCDYGFLFPIAQDTLKEAMWVGCQDDMDGSLKKLSQLLGKSITSSFENITAESNLLLENEEAIIEKLIKYNFWDLKLWEWAKYNIWKNK